MAEPRAAEWISRLSKGRPKPRAYLDARAALEARVGPQGVRRYLEVFFAFIRRSYPNHNARAFYTEATKPMWRSGVTSGLGAELDRIDGRLALQREFFDLARRGQLAVTSLRARPESDYYTRNPRVGRALTEHDKAAQWIAAGSPNKAADTARYLAVLQELTLQIDIDDDTRRLVEAGDVTPAAFGSFAFVQALHGRVYGPSAPALRSTHPVKYPSTVGGEYLVERLYRDTVIPRQSMLPDHFWTNWALYFAGMVGAAQPFADGNKRAMHTLYAAVVLATLDRFVAPTTAFENRLLAME